SKTAINALLMSIDVVNRPDLKSKLSQTLTQLATTLAQLEQFPQVDPIRLEKILKQLDNLIKSFNNQKVRIGERLRTNDFLNQIRLRLSNPGGICAYSTPAYSLWLSLPAKERLKDLRIWASEFSELQQIIDLILFLTRNSGETQRVEAHNGFYSQNLNPTLPCQIVQVHVPADFQVYPEFSVGRHRLAIRFLRPSFHEHGRPTQLTESMPFELNCCRA
ncbi:MAG: cell division protein ZapD, partial [Coxiellaceae bacterium]|nr:cell division protein ZapD [Coxiellaceae bacterium]